MKLRLNVSNERQTGDISNKSIQITLKGGKEQIKSALETVLKEIDGW